MRTEIPPLPPPGPWLSLMATVRSPRMMPDNPQAMSPADEPINGHIQ
jgi:hypothetical protein